MLKNVALSFTNISKWGKKHLAKSGDLELADTIGRAIIARTGAEKYDVVYAMCYDDIVETLSEMYPKMNLIHFNDYSQSADEHLIVLSLSVGGQKDLFNELDAYLDMLRTVNYSLCNINHNLTYFVNMLDLVESESTRAKLVSAVEGAATIISHSSTSFKHYNYLFKSSYNTHHLRDKFFSPSCQMTFYENENSLPIYNRAKTDVERNITLHRPSHFKGSHIWFKEVLRDTSLLRNSVLVTRLEMLDNSELERWFRSHLYPNYLNYQMGVGVTGSKFTKDLSDNLVMTSDTLSNEALSEDMALSQSERGFLAPNYIASSYDNDDSDFKLGLRKHFDNYLIVTDYNQVIDKDYLIFENAMADALELGLKLKWSDMSLDTMSPEVRTTAELLNSMTVQEQREYAVKHFNVNDWLDAVIERTNSIYDV